MCKAIHMLMCQLILLVSWIMVLCVRDYVWQKKNHDFFSEDKHCTITNILLKLLRKNPYIEFFAYYY